MDWNAISSATFGVMMAIFLKSTIAYSSLAPHYLSQTGLYSNPRTKTVDSRNYRFSPQYPLWTDGAKKTRWIFIPPGQQIDATNIESWEFPIGTKIWKEFAWDRAVETRLLERTNDGSWNYATYIWNSDGSDAKLAPESGIQNVYPIGQGRFHDIPSISDCRSCHEGRRTEVLGFSALQLSPDRDPNSPHADLLDSDMLTLTKLVEKRLITGLADSVTSHPPRIAAKTPEARAAMGYLHGNCGSCHNPDDPFVGPLGMYLRYSLNTSSEENSPIAQTAIGKKSYFRIPGVAPEQSFRILPGFPSQSAILFRVGSRHPSHQMPPLGTKLIDQESLELLRRWIKNMH